MSTPIVKIALIGHAGAGKDLVWSMLRLIQHEIYTPHANVNVALLKTLEANPYLFTKEYDMQYDTFAAPLKHFIASSLGIDVALLHNQDIKHMQYDVFANTSIRKVHLDVSDMLKSLYGNEFFVNALLHRLQSAKSLYVCVGDCRYPNEYDALKQAGFTFIKVVNTSKPFEITEHTHSSELYVDQLNEDATIYNDGVSYASLFDLVCQCVKFLNIYSDTDMQTFDAHRIKDLLATQH